MGVRSRKKLDDAAAVLPRGANLKPSAVALADLSQGRRGVRRWGAYGHQVTISTLQIDMHSLVAFLSDTHIVKNVLGRHGWLNRVKLGIMDHDQPLYVAEYDDAVTAPDEKD